MRRADPHRALIRALTARFPGLIVLASSTEPWASATFTGARHVLTCDAAVCVTGVEEIDLPLVGHVVADISAEVRDGRMLIEALTIEAD